MDLVLEERPERYPQQFAGPASIFFYKYIVNTHPFQPYYHLWPSFNQGNAVSFPHAPSVVVFIYQAKRKAKNRMLPPTVASPCGDCFF